jgi:DNA repair exonuclease SbcCD nuclease subunit
MSEPLAVLISDIHFDLNTLEKASAALLQAQFKAAYLKVPLIIAGDLHNTKAQMRAEVVNKMLELFSVKDAPSTLILVGNHDLCNERGTPHALNFLKPYATIVEKISGGYLDQDRQFPVVLIPYQSDTTAMIEELKLPPRLIIMHQGVTGSEAGEYFHDATAIPASALANHRVISGHYHARQTIQLENGVLDYLGSPFSHTFGEAKDPEKGFQILNEDLSLTFVPINLPTHRVMTLNYISELRDFYGERPNLKSGDILKVTVNGPSDELAKLTKDRVQELVNFSNIVLDIEPYTVETNIQTEVTAPEAVFDTIIDSTEIDANRKDRLKNLWRTFV